MNKQILIPFIIITLSVVGCEGRFEKAMLKPGESIKVGVLHSLSGTMAISEKPVVDATLMAIEEINEEGGLLGRKIEPIVIDGKSDWPTFAKEAERLISEEKVSVIFGCWTSASRKTVKPIFEKYDHLLFYPVQYEGLESSPNIIYTGAAPNQQIIPAVKWAFDNLGKRFFLVASDYVFPRSANAIIKDQVAALRGTIVGEEYVLLGSHDVEDMVQKIIKTKPDVILNTINGDSNLAFFEELAYRFKDSGINKEDIPIISFSIAEAELIAFNWEEFPEMLKEHIIQKRHPTDQHITHEMIGNIVTEIKDFMTGNYASWNYFQSIDTQDNKSFIERFKNKYGQKRVTDDPMEAGYFGVYLWAQAVEEAGTDDVRQVRKVIVNQSFKAPEGMVYVEPENNHVWKTVRIGRIKEDGQFDIVWSSENPIKPLPYPIYRSKLEWDKMLQDLYDGWGGRWANPGK